MRRLKGIWLLVARGMAICLCGFHLYTGIFGLLPSFQQRSVHVGLGLMLVFLFYPVRKTSAADVVDSKVPPWDLLLIGIILTSTGYIFLNFLSFMPFMIVPATSFQLIFAGLTLVTIVEAGRRTIGWVFPILTTIMIVYAFWGEYVPGVLGHPPIAWRIILENVYLSARGIWGFLTGLSATYIAMFIIFGAFLLASGGGETFTNLALALTGKYKGGPAKVAVLASATFAMLSGSASANVATTGNFTIPMMKKLGYKPEFAAGVEATASTGGALTPPIMGSAAFVMAELLEISYIKVMVAAIIPAFLFYTSVFFGVHMEAVKRKLLPVPRSELPSLRAVLSWQRLLLLILPIGTMLYLLFTGYSLTTVASLSCAVLLVTHILLIMISNRSLAGIRQGLQSIGHCFEAGGKTLISLVPILVCANIVLFLLNFTGLGVKISRIIMSMGEDNVVLSVILTAGLVMILGTGLPIVAAYLLGVIIAAPMLIALGILPLAAHMLCLYYCVLANLTPPVCSAVFVASLIAKSDWLKTAWVALRLAPLLYFVPFLFVFDNTFLMIGSPGVILLNVGTAAIGGMVLSSGIMGQLLSKCNFIEIMALVGSGVLLLIPGYQTDLLGVALALAILIRQLHMRKAKAKGSVSF